MRFAHVKIAHVKNVQRRKTLHIYENLLENIDHDRYSCCLFLLLSKVFDTVDHKILLYKLERLFGMRGTVLSLMRSYLTNRYQYTKI